MSTFAEQVVAGQAVYSKRLLSVYDLTVLGFSNRLIWNSSTQRVLELYDAYVTGNHLDVGVGTGYFLDHCRTLPQAARIALVDLNQNSLDFTARRIFRYRPQTYRRNVLEPIAIDGPRFDSVSMSYLLHCLPGAIDSKAVAFDHLAALMNPGAVLFGATLLHDGVPRTWLAKRMMDVYNKKGIFSNQRDNLAGLKRELHRRFRDVSLEVVGCAALFAGRI
jgi:SAM-dependent methyltransferase